MSVLHYQHKQKEEYKMLKKKTLSHEQLKQVCDRLSGIFEHLAEARAKGLKEDASILKKIKTLFKQHPELLTYQNLLGCNLGMSVARDGLENITLIALDNHVASIQQSHTGYNIGMFSAASRLEIATLKALDNHEASIQQNESGENIGMLASDYHLEQAVLKALDNPVASVQQDKFGKNIGMHAVEHGLKQATYKALQNPAARKQKDERGNTIESKAQFFMKDVLDQFYADNDKILIESEIDEISDILKK